MGGDTASYFFDKAKHYRRLAARATSHDYLTQAEMLALADEFETKARAAAERTKAAQEVATPHFGSNLWMAIWAATVFLSESDPFLT